MLNGAKRTAAIHLGSASAPDKSFHGYDYAANFFRSMDDKNYTQYSDAHPQIDNVFYYDKTIQPTHDPCMGSILTEAWGAINPETLYSVIPGKHHTGNC